MKNLSIRTMFLMASMSMAMNGSSNDGIECDILGNETDESKERRRLEKEEEYNLSIGLEKFWYGDDFVWARNQKNADRKAKNKGYTKNE